MFSPKKIQHQGAPENIELMLKHPTNMAWQRKLRIQRGFLLGGRKNRLVVEPSHLKNMRKSSNHIISLGIRDKHGKN